MVPHEEIIEVVDIHGSVISTAARSDVHRNPALIHQVVHVLVFDRQGNLLLQKRSMDKDVAPGKWDTSVGGHVAPGEDIHAAAQRELREELGIEIKDIVFLHRYLFTNSCESELVSTFTGISEGEIVFNKKEIDGVKYWSPKDITDQLGRGVFSNHFEREFIEYLKHRDNRKIP